jgi:Na+-driven multidrug efflux pump
MGLILVAVKAPVLSLYNVSPEVIVNAGNIITVMAFFVWVRVNNMTIVVGVLRAGGDTRFSLFLDGIIIWLVGVPMAWLGANLWHLPVHLVYLCSMSEESAKWVLGMRRYFSRRWIHNLVMHVEDA